MVSDVWKITIFSIILIIAVAYIAVAHGFEILYEELADSHIANIISLTKSGITQNYTYYGYCDHISTLLGVYYSLKTGDYFYIVRFPSLAHSVVIINNTLYTTEASIYDYWLKFTYRCKVNDRLRQAFLTNNKVFLSTYGEQVVNNIAPVECQLVFGAKYNKVVPISFVKMVNADELRQLDNIEKIIIKQVST